MILRRAYIDTSAIQKATASYPSGALLENVLAQSGFELALGFHVVYELTRAFVKDNVATMPCLRVLSEMDHVRHIPQPQILIQNEVEQLLHGGKVLDVVSPELAGIIKAEIYMLARGHVAGAKRFIADRERRIRLERPRIHRITRELIRDMVRADPGVRPKLRTWDGFRMATREHWSELVSTVTGKLPTGLLDTVFDRPSAFPVLNTWLNSQLHLQFLSWNQRELPAISRLDDYRNILESNAAEIFVSDDVKQLRRFGMINPFRTAISWREFLPVLEKRVKSLV